MKIPSFRVGIDDPLSYLEQVRVQVRAEHPGINKEAEDILIRRVAAYMATH